VSRWERGDRSPRDFWLPYLARVLDLDQAELERAKVRVRDAGDTKRETTGDRAILRTQDELERVAVLTPSFRRTHSYTETRIEEIVAHLREQWHWLVRTDNLLGPRFALEGVLNQLSVVDALLTTDLKSQRRGVVQLGAQYAESAAWLNEDSGNLSQARYWTGRSLEWACEADDLNMLAWTFYRRSQLASRIRDVVQTITLAQTARRGEVRLPAPIRAAIRVQEARGHAMNGNESTAHRLLEEAHRWATVDNIGDARGGHGSFCTASYIELNRAGALMSLGQPRQAISIYEQALPELPAVYERDRAAALSGMAAAYAAANEPSQAASTAIQSLRAARAAGSVRIVREIGLVAESLRSAGKDRSVSTLLQELVDQEPS
jgi:tetratricopeptide (TPR) repeat protein